LEGLSAPITHCSFSAFGARVAACASDGTWKIWDTSSGKEVAVDFENRRLLSVEFQPGGSRLLLVARPVIGADEHVSTILTRDGRTIELKQTGVPAGIRFGPRGERILSVGMDSVRVWNAVTGEQELAVDPETAIGFAGFDPEGQQLLTYQGRSVSVWDEDGAEMISLSSDLGFRMTASGDHLGRDEAYVITDDRRLRVVPLDPSADPRIGRSLTDAERARYHLQLGDDEQAADAKAQD
jgi:WD40 repeat protein